MEGYRSPPSSSTTQQYSSPVKESTPASPVVCSTLSANEVLRQVFPSTTPGSGGYIPLPSPSKRRHKVKPDVVNVDAPSVDRQSTDQDEIMEDISGGEKMDVERPIKPLRRSVRSTKVESSHLIPHRLSKTPEVTDINSTQELDIAASDSTGHSEDVFLELQSNTAPQ